MIKRFVRLNDQLPTWTKHFLMSLSITGVKEWVQALFQLLGVRLRPCLIWRWTWTQGPFSLQTDLSDARYQITLEPINGAEPLFPETATIQFSRYRLSLFPMQLGAVRRVNFFAKSKRFPFPMILV